MKPRLVPLGDSALLVELGAGIDPKLNRRVHGLDAWLRSHPLAGVIENVPAYASLVIHYDPMEVGLPQVTEWAQAALEQPGNQVQTDKQAVIEIPVRYGGEAGPDIEHVAQAHGLSPREVAEIHASRDYTVYMMGFTPGFPYLGTLDERIATPRLAAPRTHVQAGSVGIAESQTGIYPIDSPGGWQIIGRTSVRLFEPASEHPFLLAPGCRVHFVIEAIDA